MRISDWSSDVCSSDLAADRNTLRKLGDVDDRARRGLIEVGDLDTARGDDDVATRFGSFRHERELVRGARLVQDDAGFGVGLVTGSGHRERTRARRNLRDTIRTRIVGRHGSGEALRIRHNADRPPGQGPPGYRPTPPRPRAL